MLASLGILCLGYLVAPRTICLAIRFAVWRSPDRRNGKLRDSLRALSFPSIRFGEACGSWRAIAILGFSGVESLPKLKNILTPVEIEGDLLMAGEIVGYIINMG